MNQNYRHINIFFIQMIKATCVILPDANAVLWIIQSFNASQEVREAVLCVACEDGDQHCGLQQSGLPLGRLKEMIGCSILCAAVQEQLSC